MWDLTLDRLTAWLTYNLNLAKAKNEFEDTRFAPRWFFLALLPKDCFSCIQHPCFENRGLYSSRLMKAGTAGSYFIAALLPSHPVKFHASCGHLFDFFLSGCLPPQINFDYLSLSCMAGRGSLSGVSLKHWLSFYLSLFPPHSAQFCGYLPSPKITFRPNSELSYSLHHSCLQTGLITCNPLSYTCD